jgi:hypothetical protein
MAHLAKVENGIVTNVIVIDKSLIGTGIWSDANTWIVSDYSDTIEPSVPARVNYAKIGSHYDSANDVFYSPQPFPSWTLDTSTWKWKCPVDLPEDTGRIIRIINVQDPEHIEKIGSNTINVIQLYGWDEANTCWSGYTIPPIGPMSNTPHSNTNITSTSYVVNVSNTEIIT